LILGFIPKSKGFTKLLKSLISIPCLSGLPADRHGKAGLLLNQGKMTYIGLTPIAFDTSMLLNDLELSSPVVGTTLLGFVGIDGIRSSISFINNPFRFDPRRNEIIMNSLRTIL
jgi:hypothetical protein